MLQEVGILPTLFLVSIFFANFWVKMVECVKGLFGQKKFPKPDVLHRGDGKLCLDEGVRQGEGGLHLGELKASFQVVFCLS